MSQTPSAAGNGNRRNVTLLANETETVGGHKVRAGLPSGGMDATIVMDGVTYDLDGHYSAHRANVQSVTNNGPGTVDLLIFD